MTGRTGWFVGASRGAIMLAIVLLAAAAVPVAQEKAADEGIKVHGHWTIDVKNPDGTIASHHEFENALQFAGQFALSGLLSGQISAGGWAIYSQDPGGFETRLIQDQGTVAHLPPSITSLSNNLTVTAPTSPSGNTQALVVLQGSAMTPSMLQIATVGTYMTDGIRGGFYYTFTAHTLPQPITVAANQIVQITVVFSFS